MDLMDLVKNMPGGNLGIGGLLGLIGAAAIYFRQYLSGANASRASDAGQIAALAVYQNMVDMLRKSESDAQTRADTFARERNEAIAAVGKLQGQMEAMARQLEVQSSELQSLREQVRKLTEQLNAKT
jgi:chromosome segregation ATPase